MLKRSLCWNFHSTLIHKIYCNNWLAQSMLYPRLLAANCYDHPLDIPWVSRSGSGVSPAPAANHGPVLAAADQSQTALLPPLPGVSSHVHNHRSSEVGRKLTGVCAAKDGYFTPTQVVNVNSYLIISTLNQCTGNSKRVKNMGCF